MPNTVLALIALHKVFSDITASRKKGVFLIFTHLRNFPFFKATEIRLKSHFRKISWQTFSQHVQQSITQAQLESPCSKHFFFVLKISYYITNSMERLP